MGKYSVRPHEHIEGQADSYHQICAGGSAETVSSDENHQKTEPYQQHRQDMNDVVILGYLAGFIKFGSSFACPGTNTQQEQVCNTAQHQAEAFFHFDPPIFSNYSTYPCKSLNLNSLRHNRGLLNNFLIHKLS